MIALTFLLIIGGILLADGLLDCYNFSVAEDQHIELNKNYAYLALGFALLVEAFNMKERKVRRRRDMEFKGE
jgi:predicted tellurium resistance membrane protein TerC